MRLYLAYGSNLNMKQMLHRCPDSDVFGTAVLKDHRLVFKGTEGNAHLTVEPVKGENVPLGVWEVSDEDEKRLDKYEGYPIFYSKGTIRIEVSDIRTGEVSEKEAFMYVMSLDRDYATPSKKYLNTCTEGYVDFDFDLSILSKALKRSVKK